MVCFVIISSIETRLIQNEPMIFSTDFHFLASTSLDIFAISNLEMMI